MIKMLAAAALVTGFTFTTIAHGQAVKAAAVSVEQSEAVVKLISVDPKSRTAVMATPSGATMTLNIPPEAQNLDRVKPGDLFKLRYVESVVLALNKGGTASASEMQTVELAPKGGNPGGRVVNTKNLTVSVQDIDREKRTVTVRGPGQQPSALKVADEVRSFDEIKVGDTITLTYVEALALEMIPQSTGATR